jgi:hypothetical protein
MGRPLKIAKGTILTITDVDGTNEYVTVSDNLTTLNIIAGMPFVTASTVGGMTGGTTYWILEILSSSTFSVSTVQPSANPNFTRANLTTASSVSVKASVGLVDTGFFNPDGSDTATNSVTYGVVGGNTSLYGKQTLCNVAFGVSGTGTVFASTSSNIVAGLNTDFANVATGTHVYALWGDGTGTPMLLGTASSTHGINNVAVANTKNSGNVIRTSGNAQTLLANGPVTFSANLGGLFTDTTYFVLNIANSSAFTVSLTQGGAEVDLSDATGTPNASQDRIILGAASANNAVGATGYGDGFVTALPEAGYIVRQKGKTKYLVTGTVTGITGAVYTANVANTGLTPNTMTIISTTDTPSTLYISSLNDYNSEVFPTQVAAGSLSAGTQYTIYVTGSTDWTAVGAASNMTGVTFTATGAGSGTGTAIAISANPDVIATFNTAYAANTYGGQPNPIVVINNA